MRAHEIDAKGKALIVDAIESQRSTLASGTSVDGYVKKLTMSRLMFYVEKNGGQTYESTSLDDAIARYNET